MRVLNRCFLLVVVSLSWSAVAQDYVQKKAQEKSEYLWKKTTDTAYGGALPEFSQGGLSGIWNTLKGLYNLSCPSFNSGAFRIDGDFMPGGRQKHIHSFGTSVLVEYSAEEDSPYTGLFKEGAAFGILRLSLATAPKPAKFVPGFAVKFLIDGDNESVNIFAMPSLTGQDDPNLFVHNYTTVIPTPPRCLANIPLEILESRFKAGLDSIGYTNGNTKALRNDHAASITEKGEHIYASPKAPYQLIFVPTEEAQALLAASSSTSDFRALLENQGNGIVLFEVFGKQSSSSEQRKIGAIKTTSGFIASAFGDDELFFKHPYPHEE